MPNLVNDLRNFYIDYWGQNLQPLQIDNSLKSKLRIEDRHTLLDVGLPELKNDAISFLISTKEQAYLKQVDDREYIIVGTYGYSLFGLDSQSNHVKWVWGFDAPRKPAYINSNIEFFLLFFAKYHALYDSYWMNQEISQSSFYEEIEILENKFRTVDKFAFDNESDPLNYTHFWPTMLYETKYGLV